MEKGEENALVESTYPYGKWCTHVLIKLATGIRVGLYCFPIGIPRLMLATTSQLTEVYPNTIWLKTKGECRFLDLQLYLICLESHMCACTLFVHAGRISGLCGNALLPICMFVMETWCWLNSPSKNRVYDSRLLL